jgi:hypothetical protein
VWVTLRIGGQRCMLIIESKTNNDRDKPHGTDINTEDH